MIGCDGNLAVTHTGNMIMNINGYKLTDTTTLVFAANPKRPHAKVHARYEAYSKAKTICEYIEFSEAHDGHKRNINPSLRYDEAHGHLKFYEGDTLLNDHSTEE
jgi:hypothetical protein